MDQKSIEATNRSGRAGLGALENGPEAGPAPGSAPQIPDYQILQRIGKGSYGEVWLARNILGSYRAVKVIYRSSFEDERPFEREYSGMRKYEPVSRSHQSQVGILHVGRGGHFFYYVMELADDAQAAPAGEHETKLAADASRGLINPELYAPKTLRSELRRRGSFPVDESLKVAASLSTALEHLHRHGLVHRDIKPSNIIFVEGVPKLADIGLVASLDDTLSFVGTEGFQAPEGPGTAAADIFSLGKVIYEMSTGRDRQEYPELPTNIMERPDREALAELNEVTLKACARNPRQRYRSASELRADLDLLAAGVSVRRKKAAQRLMRLAWKTAGLACALGLLGAGGFWLQQSASERTKEVVVEKARQSAQARALSELMEFKKAQEAFAGNDSARGVAILTDILQINPQNRLASARLFFALSQRGFALPSVDPLAHDHWVWAAHFSRDGDKLLSISADGTARLWEVNSGKLWVPPFLHGTNITSGQLSPDGLRVVTASEDHLGRIWEVSTGRQIPLKHEGVVWFARFSPDGRKVATASWDHTARIWDAETGKQLTAPLQHEAEVYSAHFSSDGKKVVTASLDRTVRVWDAQTGLPIGRPLRHESKLWYAQISPDGRVIATACEGGGARLWEAESGEPLSGPLAHGGSVLHLEFSPDGEKLVTASADYSARVYQIRTGRFIAGPLRHESIVRSARFSPDGKRIVTASDDHTARIWSARTGRLLCDPLRHGGEVWHAEFSPDGQRVATASIDGAARIWEVVDRNLPSAPIEHKPEAVSAQFSADGRRLLTVTSGGATLRVWDLEHGQLLAEMPAQEGSFVSARFSPDGERVAAVSSGNTATIWHPASGELWSLAWNTPHHLKSAWASERGEQALLVGEEQSTPEDAELKTVLQFGRAHLPGEVPGLAAVPGRLAALDLSGGAPRWATLLSDGTARLWDWESPEAPVANLGGHAAIELAEFSPDGRLIVTAAHDHAAIIWDARTGRPLSEVIRHEHPVKLARFSPDGSLLITASEQKISLGRNLQVVVFLQVWDAATGRALGDPMRHEGSMATVEFSPDGQKVITASEDRTARVWDARTGEPLSEPFNEESSLLAAQWNNTRQQLVLVTARHIRIVKMPAFNRAWPDWLPELAEIFGDFAGEQGGHGGLFAGKQSGKRIAGD
jgi:WD40 repeat protein